MTEMNWSWEDLKATPAYVRQYCTDFIRARNEARARANGG